MGWNKQSEYTAGRNDGLLLARDIVRDGGLEALNRDLKMRGAMNINTSLRDKELDKLCEPIKQLTYNTLLLAFLSTLHDEFGFGRTRLQRAADHLKKIAAYLANGWMFWMDMVETMKKDIGLEFSSELIETSKDLQHWAHPEYQDVFNEVDLVDPEFWTKALKMLKFSERPRKGGGMEILDENGEVAFEYSDRYEQIGVYDVMTGIAWTKDHYGIK